MDFTRRQFLKTGVLLGAAAAMERARPAFAGAQEENLARRLVSVQGTDPEKMVRKAFAALGGAQRFIRGGDRVVLKPNASFANAAEWGNNTHPQIVAAVCKVCREAGARKVVVIDFPLMRGAEAFEVNGIAPACSELRGVQVRVLGEQQQFRTVAVPGGVALKEVAVAREVLDADVLINLPVAKAHDAVAASIGLKNLMGVIWDRSVFHTMMDIHQAIADLGRVVRPQLTLVDMTRVLVTNGPKGPGEVANPELLLAGVDPVALDALALGQTRFNGRLFAPKQLRYLVRATEAGLGDLRLDQFNIQKESA